MNLTVKYGINVVVQRKSFKEIVDAEILHRILEKKRKYDKQRKKHVHKRLSRISHSSTAFKAEFTDLDLNNVDAENIQKILNGDLVSHRIIDVWEVNSVEKPSWV